MTKSPAGPRQRRIPAPAKQSKSASRASPEVKPRAAPKTAPKPAGTRKSAAAKPAKSAHAATAFPIVGIGASAGGLEAIDEFLTHARADSGAAYVVVQHLDPSRKGMMPELLQRVTRMKVEQAADGMRVEPDHVYVIPPNMDMSLQRGVLQLFEFAEPRAQRLPIDFFLRSLAADHRQLAIGVILSGMGSDGTLGLRAIKETAGLTLAQDPASAKFDGMPRSAIDAGVADIVAPAQDLPDRILAYLHHAPLAVRPEAQWNAEAHGALDKILVLLRMHTGHDFSLYKKSTLYRRIERRMGIHQIDRILTYVGFLRENRAELELLFRELLIGVTSFFRDPQAWEFLKTEVLPKLFSAHPSGRELRAWVAGCSTGEEGYSLAIVFKEALELARPEGRFSLQIYATDLDRAAIEKARLGHYPANIAADVSTERLSRYFSPDDRGYRVVKEIREMLIFAPQNLIMDPPFTKLDILSCRNVLIYLGPELQKKLMPVFHYSLYPGGILFLGGAETVGNFTDLFVSVDGKARIYRRSEAGLRARDVEFPTTGFSSHNHKEGPSERRVAQPAVNLQTVADQMLLRSYAPPAVLVNRQGDIIYINGRTGKYLEPASGKANWNIFAMAHASLAHELDGAMRRAQLEKGPITVRDVVLEGDGPAQRVDLVVEAIDEPPALAGTIVVVFHDQPMPDTPKQTRGRRGAKTGKDAAALEAELEELRHELQTSREDMQSSQEELKSANEELQSTNEELQSTNEELTTSREEMQSLNEELQTVNAELETKVYELSRTSDDMKNLLNSTDIAIVFLDNDLRVRSYTDSAVRIIKLIPTDVGRPLSDIVSALDYPQMQDDAREVLRNLVYCEKEVPSHDGRLFQARTIPYRTRDNVIDGVVFTFVDITRVKKMEVDLRDAKAINEPRS